MRYPAVFAAVRVLSESCGMLPMLTYKRAPNGDRVRVQDSDDPRARMLRIQPNPLMSAMEMWEACIGILNLFGNAYLYKQRDSYGRVSALWLLPPQATQTYRDADNTLWYYVTPGPESLSEHATSLFNSSEIIHLRGFGLDGFFGLAPITLHRRAIAIGQAQDAYAENFYLNNSRPSGLLQTPNELSDAAFERLRVQWEQTHSGPDNAYKPALLEGGVTWQTLTVPNDDAQFLQSRQHQVTEIARIFRVPPHMIGDLSHATFSNIEQQSIDFVTYSLQPWLTRIEQRINLEVFDSPLDEGMFSEFLVDGLLRGDTATRYGAYAQAPWMTDNEKRRRENLPSLEGLDEPTRPLNVSTVSSADSDLQPRVTLAIAAIKAGADPMASFVALGLGELVANPATDLAIDASTTTPEGEPTNG
jgi:HK97 family phage portal protein